MHKVSGYIYNHSHLYVEILDKMLLPLLHETFPDENLCFMLYNDPKHGSKKAQAFYEGKKKKTEFSGANAIVNLWHELKRIHMERSKA